MANNRIFIRCKECGKYLFLGKGFGGAYYTSNKFYDKDLTTSLNEFYDEHAFCDRDMIDEIDNDYLEPKLEKRAKHYENNFEIAYEIYYGDLEDEELKEEGKNE